MRIGIPAVLGAALLLALPATAGAETIRYRVTLDVAGSWSESVRGTRDSDPPAFVSARDSDVRWSLSAVVREATFRDGRPPATLDFVADTRLAHDVLSSTYTDFDNESGTCRAGNAAATGAGVLTSAGAGAVLRPSSDALLDLECEQRFARYGVTVDLLRNAGSNAVPALGQGPLDAAFAFPARRFGAARVSVPVAANAAQQGLDRCPREDAAHTVACGFDWSGTVLLERRSPRIGTAARHGRTATVPVTCFEACTAAVRSGRVARSFRLAAGQTRSLRLRGRLGSRLTVRVGGERRTLRLRAA